MLKKIAVCVVALGAFAASAWAIPIFNETFEGASVGEPGVGVIPGTLFSVTAGNVDILGPGLAGFLCVGASTVNCVDLNGNQPGTISSTNTIAFTPGVYLLTFVLNGASFGGGPTTTATVQLGSLVPLTMFTLGPTDQNVINIPFSVAVNTSATLTFAGTNTGSTGAKLDDVSITSVPEPSTIGLMVGGLPLLLFLRRRRNLNG